MIISRRLHFKISSPGEEVKMLSNEIINIHFTDVKQNVLFFRKMLVEGNK